MEAETVEQERQLELQRKRKVGRCIGCGGLRYRDRNGACETCYTDLKIRIAKLEKILGQVKALLAYDDEP